MQSGEDSVSRASLDSKAKLILVTADAAENTKRRGKVFASRGKCAFGLLGADKAQLGAALGRPECVMLAVCDGGIALSIVEKLELLDKKDYTREKELLARAKRRKQKKVDGRGKK